MWSQRGFLTAYMKAIFSRTLEKGSIIPISQMMRTEAHRRLMNCLRPSTFLSGRARIWIYNTSSPSKFSSLRQCRQKTAFLMGILLGQYVWNAFYLGKSDKCLTSDRYLLTVSHQGCGSRFSHLGKPYIDPSSWVNVKSTTVNYHLSLMCSSCLWHFLDPFRSSMFPVASKEAEIWLN